MLLEVTPMERRIEGAANKQFRWNSMNIYEENSARNFCKGTLMTLGEKKKRACIEYYRALWLVQTLSVINNHKEFSKY